MNEAETFEPLRRLLALKRHEVPPPGYFNNFPERVLARLNEPPPLEPLNWWQRFGLDFELKPALVCAMGVVVSGLFAIGIVAATFSEQSPLMADANSPILLTPPGTHTPAVAFAATSKPEEVQSSTAPLVNGTLNTSPFKQFSFRAQPISFPFGPMGN